jgi:Icc-related predicted phosphoesterase
MKIWILSDLHLEWKDWTPPRNVDADVIVLAGDIGVITQALSWVKNVFAGRTVVYVAGNHEGYGTFWFPLIEQLRQAAAPLHFLERNCVVIGNTRFLGTTLWTDCRIWGDLYSVLAQKHRLSDFAEIRVDQETRLYLDPLEMIRWHERSVDWLDSQLSMPFPGPTVVVTHHAPHPRSLLAHDPAQFQPVSGYFGSNLLWLIERHQPELWVHGHTHASSDYRLGKTRVIANPAGYPLPDGDRENPQFQADLVVEV